MYDADFQECDIEAPADVLTQQEAEPACDYEEDHAARIATHHDVEAQTVHCGDNEGEDKYRVRHCSCDSVFQWLKSQVSVA